MERTHGRQLLVVAHVINIPHVFGLLECTIKKEISGQYLYYLIIN